MTKKPVEITENSSVTIPPPDLKPIIETTAEYVAKKGATLERQIAQRQSSNKKFDFLKSSCPYHDYYIMKIKEITKKMGKEKKSIDPLIGKVEVPKPKEKDKPKITKPIMDHIKEYIRSFSIPKKKFIKSGRDYKHNITPPPEIVPLDIEVIKLTAQFVAANGRSFLAAVSNREQKNPQFAFLKPTNVSLFLYFSDLVQSYRRILSPPKEVIEELKNSSYQREFDILLGRSEFKRQEQKKAESARINLEDEKKEMALIDWQTFVILETIEFNDNEDDYLPPPSMKIEEINESLETGNRVEKNASAVGQKIIESDKVEEESDDPNEVNMEDEEIEEKKNENIPTLETREQKMLRLASEEKERESSQSYTKCTICSSKVPISELEEHMRIELMDPKWKEQRSISLSKLREDGFVGSKEIAFNLERFVETRRRPNILEKRSKREENVVWDGRSESIKSVTSIMSKEPIMERRSEIGGVEHMRPVKEDNNVRELQRVKLMDDSMNMRNVGNANVNMRNVNVRNVNVPMQDMSGGPPMQFNVVPIQTSQLSGVNQEGMFMSQPTMMPMHPHQIIPPNTMNTPIPNQPPIDNSFKKPRLESPMEGMNIIPQQPFFKMSNQNVNINVVVPSDDTYAHWNFNGQKIVINLSLNQTIIVLKQNLSSHLNGMPIKKIKLKISSGGFLKDNFPLAHYNITPMTIIEVGVKARGGRK